VQGIDKANGQIGNGTMTSAEYVMKVRIYAATEYLNEVFRLEVRVTVLD
jgi:hypothetical protein